MFTEKAQTIVDQAKDCAFAHAKEELDVDSLLAAVGSDVEAGVRLAECLTNGDVTALRARYPELGRPAPCPGTLELTEPFRDIIVSATEFASGDGIPDRAHPGLIDVRHLICAIAISGEACRILGGLMPLSRDDALRILSAWYEDRGMPGTISDLVSSLRGLRAELMARVFGQDHAIHTFIEGLYNAEVTTAADRERKRPAAVFVFTGPPGVGKTYMVEMCASFLNRPFKRYDMTGYTDHQAHNQLVGFAPSYKDAHPGLLTGFVEKNPNAILLFDEIEKAHLTTVQLFYQILDAGRLEDKFTENDVNFRDTIIIFTTNAGRTLYDNPNKTGISAANSSYHKRTILSALENEKNPATGQPAFPQAICSRLSQGYPVMFNYLSVNELERVCSTELIRTEALLERQYFKHISHSSILPILLVLREGARVDARELRTEAENFLKAELFKYFSLFTEDNLEEAFGDIDEIRFEIEGGVNPEIQTLFESPDKPRILIVANPRFSSLCREHMPDINWFSASSPTEIIESLSTEDIDMVLLDIWIRREMSPSEGRDKDRPRTDLSNTVDQDLDYIPLSARALDEGREILRRIHERFPQTPTYLLSFMDVDLGGTIHDERHESILDDTPRRPIDDELFLACVRAGGARGLLATGFKGTSRSNWEAHRDQFSESLLEINRRLYREKKALSLAQERRVLTFDTATDLRKNERQLRIRLRGFSLSRAIDASDAGEMVDDVARPHTRLEDVLGVKAAKESLRFVIDWLKNPKFYLSMAIRPPKGILLTGPPGTGKTMLGRAVAGESNCAFIERSASSFVTIWQGSGPQNVRDLFERARRYAPSVVFIDEFDSIGIRRSGGVGSAHAQEETLNALLTEMDGFRSLGQQPVIVLAATNFADQLDEAIKRRFDRSIEVEKPDKATRLAYLNKALTERKRCDLSPKAIERLAGQSAGLTIADLERIVHQAAVMAAQHACPLTDDILNEAFESFRMGEAKKTEDVKTLERIARHEAGHTLVSWLGGEAPVQLTIVGRGGAGGFMEHEPDEARLLYTKSELENRICVSMAGRAAEILYYGEEEGLSTGVASDLKAATEQAIKMVIGYGMSDGFGQVFLYTPYYQQSSKGPLPARVVHMAEKIVKKQLDRAIGILNDNRRYLDRLVEEVLEKNTLYREDFEEILPPLNLPKEA